MVWFVEPMHEVASHVYTPKGSVLNVTDFQQWVVSSASNYPVLILKKGNYSVPPPGDNEQQRGAHIYLANLSNFLLDMSGVHLFMSDRHSTAVFISGMENVSLIGLSVHYKVFPTNQAYLRAIGADGKSLDVEVMEGYPLEDWKNGVGVPCYVFDPATRWWKAGSNDMYADTITPIGGSNTSMFRLHYSGNVGPNSQSIAVGDLIACRQNGGSFTIRTENGGGVHWKDITLYGGPVFGYREDYDINQPASKFGGNSYTRCSVRRPEKPAGATESPLLSTSADGFHSSGMPHGPTVDSCYFEAMPDDGIAIHGHYSLVTDVYPSNRSFVIAEAHSHHWYIDGSILRMYNTNFQVAAGLTVVNSTEISKWYMPPRNTSKVLTRVNITACSFIMVTVAEQLPSACSFDFIVSCANRTGNGFKLVNNTIHYHRARGMLIKASNGLIANNTIEGSTMAGLLMTPELFWAEADYAHNVTVINNTFINIGYTVQGVTGLGVGAVDPNHRFVAGYGHSNIYIDGNRFVNISNTNVWITSASKVTFRNNIFDHPFRHKPWAHCCFNVPHDNLMWITETSSIAVSDNCVFGASTSMKKVLNATSSVSGTGLATGVVVKAKCP